MVFDQVPKKALYRSRLLIMSLREIRGRKRWAKSLISNVILQFSLQKLISGLSIFLKFISRFNGGGSGFLKNSDIWIDRVHFCCLFESLIQKQPDKAGVAVNPSLGLIRVSFAFRSKVIGSLSFPERIFPCEP